MLGIARFASVKKWGLKSRKALNFKKWGLKHSSLIEIYTYANSPITNHRHHIYVTQSTINVSLFAENRRIHDDHAKLMHNKKCEKHH